MKFFTDPFSLQPCNRGTAYTGCQGTNISFGMLGTVGFVKKKEKWNKRQ
jgi:hypothetical protein